MESITIDLTGKFGDKMLSTKTQFQFQSPTTIRDVINHVNMQFGINITKACLEARDIICVHNENTVELKELESPIHNGDCITFFQPLAGA